MLHTQWLCTEKELLIIFNIHTFNSLSLFLDKNDEKHLKKPSCQNLKAKWQDKKS